jgi:polysaccharide export outer membrane protein
MINIRGFNCFLFILLIGSGLTSCIGSKPIPYFGGQVDSTKTQSFKLPDQLIQKGDLLSIVIYSDNPEATALYNQVATGGTVSQNMQTSGGSAGGNEGGYLVDNYGNIRLHAIGVLNVEGLTKIELEKRITEKIKDLGVLTNPYCVVRLSNFKITILGDVTSPGVFTMPAEKATVLEALSLAGDLSLYGRKDKIMLIRENQGQRTYANLDLTTPDIFSSPYFYLRQNDVLVVQADKRKMTAADQQTLQYVMLGFTAVSTIAIIIGIFRN